MTFIVVAAAITLLIAHIVAVELRRSRAETAYWRQVANRPALYDWSQEPDL